MLALHDLPDHPFRACDLPLVSRRVLDTACRDDVVRRVLRGVYVRSDLPDTVELRARAASLVLSEHAVLVDRTAAWIHGVDVFAWHETEVLPPIESFALRHHSRPRRDGVYGGTRDLAADDVVRVGGVLVTTPVRTAVDIACVLPPRDGMAELDQFLHLGLFMTGDLRRLLPRFFRRRGVVQARWLCAHADGAAESTGESWVRYEMLRRAMPTPTLQHWVEIDGVRAYRLDLAYPRHRIAIEYDGLDHHSSPEQRRRDQRRRDHLRELGWIVIVVDRHALAEDEVDRWIQEIRDAMASRRSRTARSTARNWRLAGPQPTIRPDTTGVSTVRQGRLNGPGGASGRCP